MAKFFPCKDQLLVVSFCISQESSNATKFWSDARYIRVGIEAFVVW